MQSILQSQLDNKCSSEDNHELETIIKYLDYHDRMEINYLSDYPSKNDASSEASSL